MGSRSKVSVVVAASVGAVEALKDQAGLCRWNYALRGLQQRAKATIATSLSSSSQSKLAESSSATLKKEAISDLEAKAMASRRRKEKDEALFNLTCWGPK